MLQLSGLSAKSHPANVIERCRREVATFQSGQALRKMQSTRAGEDHGRALIDSDLLISFLIEVSQLAAKGRMDVANAKLEIVPEVRHRVFEVEHHAGRAGVQHLDHELRVVCR